MRIALHIRYWGHVSMLSFIIRWFVFILMLFDFIHVIGLGILVLAHRKWRLLTRRVESDLYNVTAADDI